MTTVYVGQISWGAFSTSFSTSALQGEGKWAPISSLGIPASCPLCCSQSEPHVFENVARYLPQVTDSPEAYAPGPSSRDGSKGVRCFSSACVCTLQWVDSHPFCSTMADSSRARTKSRQHEDGSQLRPRRVTLHHLISNADNRACQIPCIRYNTELT